MAEKYGDGYRYDRFFGEGTLIGDDCDLDNFFGQSIRDQAIQLGWSNGCPVVQELTDPTNPNFGPEKMRARYAEVNFWGRYIVEQARKSNPHLDYQLSKPRERAKDIDNQPLLGKHEPESVPGTHLDVMSPMSGIYGYAAPRILIEEMGRGEERTTDRVIHALNILDMAITNSGGHPAKFLCRLAGLCSKSQAGILNVLSHFTSQGYLDEELDYDGVWWNLKHLEAIDPRLFHAFKSLTPEQRQKYGICETSSVLNI